MARYYVNSNAQANGDHEVHESRCVFLPAQENRIYLGEFNNCYAAVREAKRYYAQSNGCAFCSPDCHTS